MKAPATFPVLAVVLAAFLAGACDAVVDSPDSVEFQAESETDRLGKIDVVVMHVGGVFFNPCTGELLDWSGVTRLRRQNGTMVGAVSVATAIGLTTGTIYNLPVALNIRSNSNPNNDQSVVTRILRENIIARGPLPNARFDVTVRMIVNANGETKVDVDFTVFECF